MPRRRRRRRRRAAAAPRRRRRRGRRRGRCGRRPRRIAATGSIPTIRPPLGTSSSRELPGPGAELDAYASRPEAQPFDEEPRRPRRGSRAARTRSRRPPARSRRPRTDGREAAQATSAATVNASTISSGASSNDTSKRAANARSTQRTDDLDLDHTTGQLRERRHAVVGQPARDDPGEPRQVGVAVQRESVERDARAQEPHADRAHLVVAVPHAGLDVRAPVHRRPELGAGADHHVLEPAQVAAGIRRRSEIDDRVADQLARAVERERAAAIDLPHDASTRLHRGRVPEQLVVLRTASGGEHRRVLEQDQRVGDLTRQPPLRQPVHRGVRGVVRDRAGWAEQPRGPRHR